MIASRSGNQELMANMARLYTGALVTKEVVSNWEAYAPQIVAEQERIARSYFEEDEDDDEKTEVSVLPFQRRSKVQAEVKKAA